MKNTLLILAILLSNAANSQIIRDTALQGQPRTPAGQVPNYYQNNSMYSNNSMQYNPPPNPKAGPYTGNADYFDPTRNNPGPTPYNSTPAPVVRPTITNTTPITNSAPVIRK